MAKNEIYLKGSWNELIQRLGCPPDISESIYQDITKHYSSSGRHYHNLTHITQLLNSVELYRESLKDLDSIQLAIWFHDVIYNTLRSDNEEKSAEYGNAAMRKLGIPESMIGKITRMILATKNHTDVSQNDDDLNWFLDFDLKILGAERADYKIYSEHIRKEYNHVPGFLYRKGRKKVLSNFLKIDFLFKTEEFRTKYEKKARENLAWEIDSL